jgi:hypothetical protein
MFISSFLVLGSCFTILPHTYEQSAVTINASRWDFSDCSVARSVYAHNLSGTTFYIKAFEPLTRSELPDLPPFDSVHPNIIRCLDGVCHTVSTPYDYDWTVNEYDFSQGIYWTSNGEPTSISSDEYETWEAEFEFKCDPSSTTADPEFFIDPTQADPKLVIQFTNSWGCPVTAPSPSATPGPYSPSCTPMFQSPTFSGLSINVDLNALNGGRFGYGANLTASEYLFYKPCERIVPCPWGAICSTNDPTSSWICRIGPDGLFESCTAFGIVPNSPSFRLVSPDDLFQGFYYDFEAQDGRSARATLTCDANYPPDHIRLDSAKTDGTKLNITAASQAFCPGMIPTPIPNATQCLLNVTQGNYSLQLNLTAFETVNVSVQRPPPSRQAFDLLYSPCGIVSCPAGYDCGGVQFARLFLCEIPSNTSKFCTAYGLPEFSPIVTLTDDYIVRGAGVFYQARDERDATAFWECNESGTPGTMQLSGVLAMERTTIAFTVRSKDACIVGSGPTPTPPGHIYPNKPSPGETPGPTPLASPVAPYAIWNETHYVGIDLRRMQERAPYHATQDFYMRGKFGESYTVWSSWEPVDCPFQWACSHARANLWECWLDEDFLPYCHAVAEKHVPGFRFEMLRPPDLGAGVILKYPGEWDTFMHFRVDCDRAASPFDQIIPMRGAVVTFMTPDGQPTWNFNSTAGVVCPQPFAVSDVPIEPRPRPANGVPQQTQLSRVLDGRHVGLRLSKIPTIVATVMINRAYDYSYKSQFHYSAVDLIGCPQGRNCGTYAADTANAWECVDQGNGQCFPIGDKRYGLTMEFLNETEDLSPIKAHYEGGAGIFRVDFRYFCDPDGRPGEIEVYGIGEEITTRTSRSIVIDAKTIEVCYQTEWGQVNGGAWFVFAVVALFLAYFGIGTLALYATAGVVAPPNQSFWIEVYDSVGTAVNWFRKCGTSEAATDIYDRIPLDSVGE